MPFLKGVKKRFEEHQQKQWEEREFRKAVQVAATRARHEGYKKGVVARARSEGFKQGRGGQRSGVLGTLGNLGSGFATGMQSTFDPYYHQRKPQHHHAKSKGRTVVVRVVQGSPKQHHRRSQQRRERSLWDL